MTHDPAPDAVPANLIPPRTPADAGPLPPGWEAVCPNPAIAPVFSWGTSPSGQPALSARGNGRQECFGYLRHKVPVRVGATYHFRVVLRYAGMQDLNRHLVHGVFGPDYNDGLFMYRREGDLVVGDTRFPGPRKPQEAELRLYYRFSADGQVWWEQVSFEECAPIPPRLVKVACAKGEGHLAHWANWLDVAGSKGADLALLPEMCNKKPVADPEPLDGPTGQMMSAKARQWRMYVSGSFYERRGDLTLNTAPLYDRQGALVGTYSKNMLYDPEEDEGATPGVGFPVFKTDFGTVGIIICYDSWHPETVRLLGYKGAELILFPNAGYYVGIMAARAADNGVWIAVSSLGCPIGVWDPGGKRAGEFEPEDTRNAPDTILSYEEDPRLGMVLATLDLSVQPSPHSWGGPMRSAPGGRRPRQTWMVPLEEEIAREAKRWWLD